MNTKLFKQSRSSFFKYPLFLALVSVTASAEPDWRALDRYQETITADTFSRLVNDVYVPDGSLIQYLRYEGDSVSIYASTGQAKTPLYKLRFSQVDQAPVKKLLDGEKPLSGLKVALDPGHIGGAWARMEERFFYVDRNTDWPVQEGAINLYVSRLIRDRLTERGADVHMVKDSLKPSSSVRADELLAEAKTLPPPNPRFEHLPEILVEASQRDSLRKQVEREFYRKAEIEARAERVNNWIKPDVTICVHFNATGYGDEKDLYEENGLAFFVHGNYTTGEIAQEQQKQEMLLKLLEQSRDEELALTRKISEAFIDATGLPPAYQVEETDTMRRMGSDYIYARNLAANRTYQGPVVFLEPYFMNNRIVYARIQAGDYEGEKEIEGKNYPSIYREYADAVVDGMLRHYAPQYRAELLGSESREVQSATNAGEEEKETILP